MKNTILTLACLVMYHIAFTQKKTEPDSSNKVIQLYETVISANKSEEKRTDIPQTIEIIKSKDLELSNPQTSADMLESTGNVFVQKSQMGGGSPVLRGFEANRVLIVIDGVRMNNAIYRSGHLQDAITIDNQMLDRTEILFGPASVMYGSDALGGVMHFYTKKPVLSDTTAPITKMNFSLRHSTANKEQAAHININLGYKRIAFLTSITSGDYNDLRTGSLRPPYAKSFGKCNYYVIQVDSVDTLMKNFDPNLQRFTGYKQLDVMQKILFKQNNSISHLLNFQYSNSSNIPRYDRLQQFQSNGDPVYARWHYGPQKRVLASLKTQILSESRLFSHMNIILSHQNIDQERVTRRFKKTAERTQFENVAVYAANIDMRKHIQDKHELHYGFEGTFNEVNSKAHSTDILTGTESPAGTRYPDGGSSMRSLSAYVSHSWELSKKYIITDGIRFNNVNLQSEWKDTSVFKFPFSSAKQNNNALNGSLGFVAMPGKGWRYTVMASSGFRAPNVDDMGKVNESTSGTIIIPNPELKPEFAYNGDISIGKTFKDQVKVEAVYFYTLLQNAIVVQDDQYNGLDSVMFDGVMSKVQSAQNAAEAYIQGFSLSFLADVNDNFSMKSTVNYTYGLYRDKHKDTLVPMDHIPPVFGQTNFIYRYKKFESDFYIRYNGWKRVEDYSPSGEDNLAQATEYGMPAWYTLNLKAAVQANSFLKLVFGVENIMDVHYRAFASGVSAPGRNFIFAVRAKY